MNKVTIIGGGLAGCETAWQLAERGISVELWEQKPVARTEAQVSDHFAELVCSNSLRGAALGNAVGLLKEEMRRAHSLIMSVADLTKVPAGGALAVDRDRFSATITHAIRHHPNITVHTGTVATLGEGQCVVVATGPLTASVLASELEKLIGSEHLAYYDAISPIVSAESLNWEKVYRASRYDKGGDDAYVNCPFDREQYYAFVSAVVQAEKVAPRKFESIKYFEGCLPIEVMAERGVETLAHGPMKPVGLIDPRTGKLPYAVVQLRQEDVASTAFNIVGFQTRMTYPEQLKVFRMIPGLEQAEFQRFGSVHRNTFINSPKVLTQDLELRARPGVYFAGQITGVEGYVESSACGLLLGIILAAKLKQTPVEIPPATTALGGLFRHLQTERDNFQPSNVTWSMVAPWDGKRLSKRDRYEAMAQRALDHIGPWIANHTQQRNFTSLIAVDPQQLQSAVHPTESASTTLSCQEVGEISKQA